MGEPEVVFIRDYSSHPFDLSTVFDYWPVLGAIRQSVATGFGFRTDDSAVVKAQTLFEQPSHGTNPGRRIRFGLLSDLQSFSDFAPVHSFDSASFYPAGGTGGRVRFSPRNRNALARLWSAWEYPRNTGFVAFYFSDQVFFPKQTKRYVIGRLSECERDGTYCRGSNELGDRAEPGARMLLAAYYRYWMRPDLLQCAGTEKDLKQVGEQRTELFWENLCERSFQYVVIDKATHGSLMKNLERENLPSWVKVSLLWAEGTLLIYQLQFENPPRTPVIECRQVKVPAWDLVDRRTE